MSVHWVSEMSAVNHRDAASDKTKQFYLKLICQVVIGLNFNSVLFLFLVVNTSA